MFGAESAERLSKPEIAKFEKEANAELRKTISQAYWASATLGATILAIIPFLAGHSLHAYWHFGRYVIYIVQAELIWFLLRWGFAYNSWQTTRETLREIRESEKMA